MIKVTPFYYEWHSPGPPTERRMKMIDGMMSPKAKRSDRSGEILVDQKRVHYATVAV